MNRYQRIFVIVVDSLGVGAADDAAEYHDAGADTLGHISRSVEYPKPAEAWYWEPASPCTGASCAASFGILYKAE